MRRRTIAALKRRRATSFSWVFPLFFFRVPVCVRRCVGSFADVTRVFFRRGADCFRFRFFFFVRLCFLLVVRVSFSLQTEIPCALPFFFVASERKRWNRAFSSFFFSFCRFHCTLFLCLVFLFYFRLVHVKSPCLLFLSPQVSKATIAWRLRFSLPFLLTKLEGNWRVVRLMLWRIYLSLRAPKKKKERQGQRSGISEVAKTHDTFFFFSGSTRASTLTLARPRQHSSPMVFIALPFFFCFLLSFCFLTVTYFPLLCYFFLCLHVHTHWHCSGPFGKMWLVWCVGMNSGSEWFTPCWCDASRPIVSFCAFSFLAECRYIGIQVAPAVDEPPLYIYILWIEIGEGHLCLREKRRTFVVECTYG